MFFSLLPTKNEKNGWKALYIGKQKNITRNVYKECFIVSHEPQGKKRKKLVYVEKFDRYQNSETHK